MGSDPRPAALIELSKIIVSERPLRETLSHVSEVITAALPAAFAGMTLIDERGQPVTTAYTDEDSPEIDAAQYRTDAGPCLDAWRLAHAVRIADTAADGPYEAFCAAAVAHGIRSTLSVPLCALDEPLGALNLYSHEVDAFSDDDVELALQLVEVAAVVLVNARAFWGERELNLQLNDALSSRAVIEQAKGILMARNATLDADAAFDVLRSASQRENVKLRDIAERIVASRA
ncbi:GAF and ANTAR domain-containing protein [Aquihabitans sp. G128]|uniref:GAF and ANTAR domain-containing protein n=1 Tax=Aquihabitans sp. G128 TaxID=2849779 RepID=UPI001C21448D|nr:GAF and ANTAR domain-containing protein [Aquihabitans sp. G128]QXC62201.1 GAF and ANTAR domain-containing protein [Aquihabitans sp. G128]